MAKLYNEKDIANILEKAAPDAIVIAAHWDIANPLKTWWMNKLFIQIKTAGHISVAMPTHGHLDHSPDIAADYMALMPTKDWRKFDRINIFLFDDFEFIDISLPGGSKSFAIRLDPDISESSILMRVLPYPAMFDAWIYPVPISRSTLDIMRDLWRDYTSPELYSKHNGKFYIINPDCSIHLEERVHIKSSDGAILFIPSNINNLDGEDYKSICSRIIRILISNFQQRKIILGLNPAEKDDSIARWLANKFSQQSNFEFNGRPDVEYLYANADVLVTETEEDAKLYAQITGHKACLLDLNGANSGARDYGFCATKFSELVTNINACLRNTYAKDGGDEKLVRHLREYRYCQKTVLHCIMDLYQGRPKPEWPFFVRPDHSHPLDDIEIARRALALSRTIMADILGYAATYAFPQSRLLAAMAFHFAMLDYPEESVPPQAEAILKKYFSFNQDGHKYGDIEPDFIAALYSQALLAFIKAGNKEGKSLVEGLCEDFNKEVNLINTPCEISLISDQHLAGFNKLQHELDSLPPDIFVVGFYINHVRADQQEWLNALAVECNKLNFLTVGLLTPESVSKSNLAAATMRAVVNPAQIRLLKRINVFIVSDVDQDSGFPLDSRVLGCVHNFYLARKDATFGDAVHVMISLDGWIEPSLLSAKSHENIKNLWEGFVAPAFRRRGKNDFYFIPAGYPRLATTYKRLQELNEVPDSIVYAPRSISYTRKSFNLNTVQDYGILTIKTLLTEFPDKYIVFRPDSGDMEEPEVREIIAVFGSEPRFKLDKSPDHIYSFSHGIVLITDFSNIVNSFAFSTLRPAISFAPKSDTSKNKARETEYGFYVESLNELVKTINIFFSQNISISRRIEQARNNKICPISDSLHYIAKILPDIYNNISHSSWINIKRDQPIGKTPAELVLAMENFGEGNFTLPSLAVLSNPLSPLLAAYAVHMGKLRTPDRQLMPQVQEAIVQILNISPPQRFRDMESGYINKLYDMARDMTTGDPFSIRIINDLQARFKQDCGKAL